MLFTDDIRLGTEAAGDNDFAVFVERRTNGIQRFVTGRIKETAGVDDDHIGTVMLAGDFIAFGAQAGDDALGIDQCLGAAEGNKGNTWSGHAKNPKMTGAPDSMVCASV